MLNTPESGIDVTDKLRVRRLGPVPYVPTWHAMQQLTQDRDPRTVDEIWLLEHPPVFTQGQAGKTEHLLAPGNIPVVQVDRGGQVTYHGPGQLMVYLLVDLARKKIGVRDLVTAIEQSVVDALAEWNIDAAPRKEAPGVYVGSAKIASLGLRIRRGRSFHGVALNVSMDMRPFGLINPCGYAGMAMTQMADFYPKVTLENAADQLLSALCGHLQYLSVEFTSAKPDCWAD